MKAIVKEGYGGRLVVEAVCMKTLLVVSYLVQWNYRSIPMVNL